MIQLNRGKAMAAEIKCDPELEIAHVFIDMAGNAGVLIDQKLRGQKGSENQLCELGQILHRTETA